MSHTQKYKAGAAGQLGAHIDRTRGQEHRYGNPRIDPERTHLNYDLAGISSPLSTMVADAIAAAPRTVRSDAVLLASTITTLPANWPDGRDSREFFEAVRAFDLRFWPSTWVEARATVHMDETRPHMHHVALPLDADRMPAWSRTYTRSMYQRYHAELQDYVCRETGVHDLQILLDDEGAHQLSALSQQDYVAARAELERTQTAVEQAHAELEAETARLEGVRRRRKAVDKASTPGGVTLGALVGDRGAATHRSELAAEKSQLSDEVAGLERRVDEAERGLRRLRGRATRLRARVAVALEALRGPLTALLARVGLAGIDDAPRGVQRAVGRLGLDQDAGRPSLRDTMADTARVRASYRDMDAQTSTTRPDLGPER